MADKSGLQGASVAYASLSDSELQYILRENGDDPASVARLDRDALIARVQRHVLSLIHI